MSFFQNSFDEAYPRPDGTAAPWGFVATHPHECATCGAVTAWQEIAYGEHFCSEACLDARLENDGGPFACSGSADRAYSSGWGMLP
jgi:hypothetical protein